ncbi:hypothetical protein DH2020_036744 [Rehmannia glutinosa]|uniref:C2 NT-type domain-containing protein n=1 Tax=Rehmannia glutinosa TaxID=99300 RepID=A0ABR0V5B6_REHGL
MSSEVESTKHDDEDFSCGLLLRDIEEISKALYLQKTPRKPFNSSNDHRPNVAAETGIPESKSSAITQNLLNKDKKSSLWNWRPLKALAHIRNHRFNCCFFLHVHAIEGLPPSFDNLNLCVTWKRKADMLRTRPATVCLGMAEFEETLMHRCTVYGSRTGPHGSAKYEPKIFLLNASVIGAPELDIGNHWIDLSRLLPLTLEELAGDKSSSGKWTTSFNLTGEAKGAMLHVSFGFSILDGNSFEPGYFVKVPDILREGELNHFADFDMRRISTEGSYLHSQSANVKLTEEIFPKHESELSHSVTLLYRKFDEGKIGNVKEFDLYHEQPDSTGGNNDTDFDIIEQGIEVYTKDQIRIEKCGSQRFDSTVIETIDVSEIFDGDETAFDEYVEWKSKLTDNHDKPGEDFSLDINKYYEHENYTKSLSLDDVSESIENDFLNMLTIDQSQDDIAWGNPILDADDCDLSLGIQTVERNQSTASNSVWSRRNAKVLENLETEALMHEWGITEKAFQYSPHASSGGFGSPVYIPLEEPLKLPSIEEGFGPIIRTKDGGFLRSMNPLLFTNANNGARLIVQVSAPVVLPPAMGFTMMEILQRWASGGVEKMCIQVNELMPLEDVTGKTMQQVLSEAESGSIAFNRWGLQWKSDVGDESFAEKIPNGHPPFSHSSENISCSNSEQIESDYASFEDLIPMAITNIEGLLVQGLKIQSGMPDQEAPSNIMIHFARNADVDELMKYSLTLEEWVKLDSGEFCVRDSSDKNKLFAAHCVEDETVCGVFGENFKMGFKVQLRDPSRNYETVGSSMLALIQVDRLNEHIIQEGNDLEKNEKKICRQLFKVSEAHLAGLNVTHFGNKQLWSTSRQQQSGSRWLLSSGMAKSNKKSLVSNSNAVIKASSMRKAWPGNVLWSISFGVRGEAATWDDQVALNVHVRNPDIIFPTESVK